MNICKNCVHFKLKGEAWYEMWCMCPQTMRPARVNPQTGDEIPREPRNARDVNPDGKCAYYSKKKEAAA